MATNFGSAPFVIKGTSHNIFRLIMSLTVPALLSIFSGQIVRYMRSLVSNALASEPEKSLPNKKSWFKSGWTITSIAYANDVPLSPSKWTKMSVRPVICWRAPVAVTSTVGTLFCFNSIFTLLANCRKVDVLITLFAQPLSCSALIGILNSLGEFCEPLISRSM